MNRLDIAQSANRRIWDFVHQRANGNLLPGDVVPDFLDG